MTFRVRTALVVLALTAMTLGAALAVVWQQFVAAQRRQLDDALLEVAVREAAHVAAGYLDFTDAPGPSANSVGPLPKYGVAYGIDGMPLANTANLASIPSMPRLAPYDHGFDFDHDGLVLRAVVVAVPNTGRRILMATSRLDLEEDASILATAMAIAFAVGCVWAGVVAFTVAARLTREHAAIASVARRVASGDTGARVELRSSNAELGQLASDLNAMIDQLTRLLDAQDRFIRHAAHELRTPLKSLRIELESALDGAGDRAHYQRTLRRGIDSARRLTDLAEDLLQLARVKAAPSEEVSPVEDALADAIADVAPVGRTRDVFVVVEAPSARVRGDHRGLARVFRNLLETAIEEAPRGTRIFVSSRVERDRIVIAGRTDPSTSASAAGDVERRALRFSIARGLARAFGGEVTATVDGHPGFEVELARAGAERT